MEGIEWAIERINIGTGDADASGVVLESGRLFGSSVSHGVYEFFHGIKKDSLQVWSPSGEVFGPRLRPKMSGRSMGRKEKSDARKKILDRLKACHGNVVRLGEAGARGAVKMFWERQSRREGMVLARRRYGSCVAAECLNAVSELRGSDAAVAVRERMSTL